MNWPLKRKLYLAFGALIVLLGVLSAVTLSQMNSAQELQVRQLAYAGMAHDAQELKVTLLQSRRHEKDFFAREGEEKYLKQQEMRKIEFAQILADARKLVGEADPVLNEGLAQVEQRYAAYHEGFANAAARFLEVGNHDSGLQGAFRDSAHSVEEQAQAESNWELSTHLLNCRRAEKDFLLRGDLKYQEKFNAHADSTIALAKTLASGPLILPLMEDYRRKFNAAVAASVALEQNKKILHDTTTAIEEAVDSLVEKSNEKTKLVQGEIAKSREEAQFLMFVLFGFSIIVAVGITRVLSNQLTSAVAALMEGTARIGRGDLTTRVEVNTQDELGELAGAFNQMGDNLKVMTGDVITATERINEVVNELRATVAEQGAALQQQASSVSETVSTVDEMSRSSQQVAETAGRVLDSAGRAADTSRDGEEAITQSVQGMHDVREQVQNIATTILELSDKTQQIGAIIATVDDFAEQSSLLALNASIEAARAGEEGKAFSVVAGEVKNLAEQSQRATEKVRGILSDIQRATHTAVMVTEEGNKRVDRGVELVGGAGSIIQALSGAIEESGDAAKQIASASRQQSNGVEQITVAVSGIDEFSRQNLEAIRQTEGMADILVQVAAELKATSDRYRA